MTNNRSKQNESPRSNLIIVNIDKLLDTLPAGPPKFIPPWFPFIFKYLCITTKGENCVRMQETELSPMKRIQSSMHNAYCRFIGPCPQFYQDFFK